MLQDAGAYPRIGAFLPSLTRLMTPGTYAFPKVESVARAVVTTTTPIGAYRGAGRPEATAAVERAMDLFAAEIGMDPAEVRRRNLLPPFTEPHAPTASAPCTTAATSRPRWRRRWRRPATTSCARSRPSGGPAATSSSSASAWPATSRSPAAGASPGAPNENATLEVHPDGSATILTGASPHGQGHQTAWAMLASEELGIPVEKITLKWGDTDLVPRGRRHRRARAACSRAAPRSGRRPGSCSTWPGSGPPTRSRPTRPTSRFDLAAPAFTVAGVAQAAVSLGQLAVDGAPVRAHASSPPPGATFPFGAHVAVAEVDTETGQAVLRRLVAVDDAGTMLNPLLAEGQRHGGIAQGVAQALLEEVVYDADGNPLTASFADYPFLSADRGAELRAGRHGHARRRTTRWGPRASARPARSAPPRPCRTP